MPHQSSRNAVTRRLLPTKSTARAKNAVVCEEAALTRDQEIAYFRRRAREELLLSVSVRGAGIMSVHYELATRYAEKARLITADRNWRPTLLDD